MSSGSGFRAQAGTATPYEGNAGSFHAAEPRISLDLFYGAGSVVSTAQDLAHWDRALMTKKSSERRLDARAVDEWHTAEWAAQALRDGLRRRCHRGASRNLAHGYSPKAGGYCLNAIFPEDDLAVIVLSNSPDSPFRGQPEKIVKSVLALYDPRVREQKEAAAASGVQDDPAVHALAMKMWDQLSSGNPDRLLLSPEMNVAMTPELLASAALHCRRWAGSRI